MKNLLAILLIYSTTIPGIAQRKAVRNRVTTAVVKKTKKQSVVEESRQSESFLSKEQLSSTAKLMFVDSIVVEKDDFYKYIPLPAESGSFITIPPNGQQNLIGEAFVNGQNRQCFYAAGDTLSAFLFCADKLANGWAEPQKVKDITNNFNFVGFPCQLSDGMPLFFAGKGKKSLGGYDIFMTRYDREKGFYLLPENYGLPFNSTANDYLLVIDEPDSLGWLVTDRHQPEGKVCIYTFVPTKVRKTYETDNLTDAELYSLAIINKIADTWQFGNRQAALRRLERLRQRTETLAVHFFSFPIDDHSIYIKKEDFKNPQNIQQLEAYQMEKEQLVELKQQLNQLREEYKENVGSFKANLKEKIKLLENEYIQLKLNVKRIHKDIINSENNLINN